MITKGRGQLRSALFETMLADRDGTVEAWTQALAERVNAAPTSPRRAMLSNLLGEQGWLEGRLLDATPEARLLALEPVIYPKMHKVHERVTYYVDPTVWGSHDHSRATAGWRLSPFWIPEDGLDRPSDLTDAHYRAGFDGMAERATHRGWSDHYVSYF